MINYASRVLGWICTLFLICLFFLPPIQVDAYWQKARKPSRDEIQEITRQELERNRALAEEWKTKWAREYDVRKGLEAQLSQLRAAVAKAAKL